MTCKGMDQTQKTQSYCRKLKVLGTTVLEVFFFEPAPVDESLDGKWIFKGQQLIVVDDPFALLLISFEQINTFFLCRYC